MDYVIVYLGIGYHAWVSLGELPNRDLSDQGYDDMFG